MTKSEQHRMIEELRDYLAKMEKEDRYTYEMFAKRDKDDEDLDSISRHKLEQMHARYIVRKSRKDLDELLRKLSSDRKDDGP